MAKKRPELKFDDVTEADEKVKVLYYGEPGTGKTSHLASLALLGKVVHVDAEAGVKARPLRELGIPIENIRRFRQITFDELDALFWQIKGELADGNGPVGVIWDSTTEIQVKLLELTVEQAVEKAQFQNKERSRHFVARDDWGTNTAEMRELVRKFRDLDCHVGFACLERRTQDEDSGDVSVGPDLTPKLARDMLGYCDIICHTIVTERPGGEDEFTGVMRPAGKFVGKDRFKVLPRRLVTPTMDRIVAYITEGLSRDTDDIQLEAEDRWAAERSERKTEKSRRTA